MGKQRIDIEVEGIDLSCLCYEDGEIATIQVFQGSKWIGGVYERTYKSVDWMFTDEATRQIGELVATKIADLREESDHHNDPHYE
jgi:hypothetical protein